jgi:hypothetical protein
MTKYLSVLLSFCLIAPFLFLVGCSASKQANNTYLNYEDDETGWSTRYPSSWEIVANPEAAAMESRGQKKIETTVDRKIDMVHTRLLWIRNGPKNSFTSNKMVFEFPTAAAYNANYKKIYDVVVKTQEREGIKLDYTDGTMIIDGLEFKTFKMTIYSKTGNVAGHQLVCTRYINGRIGLLLNINYTNEKDKQILMSVLTSSKLKVRN